MNENLWSKLSASFLVLVMTLSLLGALAPTGGAQAPTQKNIYIPVGSSGIAVTDAWVNLTNVYTGDVIAATYNAARSSYVVTNAPSGYYRVDVVAPNHYDKLTAAEFAFDGFSNYTVSPIELEAFPYKGYEWNVSVRQGPNPVMNALVGFYNPSAMEFVATKLTNSEGRAVFNMFGTSVDYLLVVMKTGLATYLESVTVTGPGWRNISMSPSLRVTGFASDANGPAHNVVAYLINKDNTVPGVVRVLKSVGSYVAFDAYPGNFTLVVDADDASAYVTSVSVVSTNVALSIPQLAAQTQRVEYTNLTYGSNFNAFSLSVTTMWSYDDACPGLRYADMGSLRAQIDLVLGDGDGLLEAAEISMFATKVQSFGSPYPSSHGLLTVNGTAYKAGASTVTVSGLVANTPVTDMSGVRYSCTCGYAPISGSGLDVGAPSYSSAAYVRYDTSSVDRKYAIALPGGYELVANSSTSQVVVRGYTTVSIDPSTSISGVTETVTLMFEKSVRPSAGASVEDPDYAYAVMADGNVTRYIVAVGKNVTLKSSESEDPNGNPLTFTWRFGDGSPNVVTREQSVVHKYLNAASVVVNLTVTDVAGLTNWTEINVTCDGLAPTPVITVKNKAVDPASNSIAVDQRELVYFNATSSVDDAVAAGDRLGVIDHVQFEWGDGNKSSEIPWTANEQNVSHSYERSGTYTVVLNVTDVVGNWANTTLIVKVNDTSPPTVIYVFKNATWGDTIMENTTVIFSANDTYDNVDSRDQLYFSWDFGDNSWLNGTGAEGAYNVTHNYTKTGSFTVRLNVSDTSGNYKIENKLVIVISGPRPSVQVDSVWYDPESPWVEDRTGYIMVNLTNKGSVNATNVVLSFYIIEADGKQKAIGTWSSFTLNGSVVTVIQPGQTVLAKFPYSPSSKGTYTIRVNVTSDNQLRPYSYTVGDDDRLQVNPAAWKEWALWLGVLAVIVLLPLAIYFSRRLARREKKGPRREKKEKEKAGGEQEEEL